MSTEIAAPPSDALPALEELTFGAKRTLPALAFDIETVPLASALAAPYPEADRQPPANYKTDEAIAKWRERDRESWADARVKACGLNPRLGRVVAIGFAWNGPDAGSSYMLAVSERGERDLLEEFWRSLADARTAVTWNGQGFDLPFLLVRSLAHGLTPSVEVSRYLRRYSYTPHCDVKCALLNWDVRREGEGLDEWAAFFGLPTKPMRADTVHAAVRDGQFKRVGEYAEHDAATTLAIYERVSPFYG